MSPKDIRWRQRFTNFEKAVGALEHRNLTAHTYDEATSIAVEKLIRERYFPIIKALCQKLQQEVQ